jgi:uncharacterized protein YbjT (DUF2867 family)
MNVLVTGGTGLIGGGLIPALLRRGHSVRLLSRGAQEEAGRWPSGVEPFAGDIADANTIRGAADGCDAVIHIAGIASEEPPDSTFERVNVAGTSNMLQEADRTGVARFVFLSSLGADRGESDYHRSKFAAERVVTAWEGDWVIVRPGNVYGPGDEVISTLLKMVRTLPAVPMVDFGTQPFQPIWHEDLADFLAETLDRPEFSGRILEVAGNESTNTRELLSLLSEITGRQPLTVPVPSTIANIGAKAAEIAGSVVGIDMPFDENKLAMLREGNVIRSPEGNALALACIEPMPLEDGLRILADNLPEQEAGDGVGPMTEKRFWVDFTGSPYTPEELMTMFRQRCADLMPLEFDAEPGSPQQLDLGTTLTARMPVRGNVQVRVVDMGERSVTLATVEGHPLSGSIQFRFEGAGESRTFEVLIRTRAANLIDAVVMGTAGAVVQDYNWRELVRGVVQIADAQAASPVNSSSRALPDAEAERVEKELSEAIESLERRRVEQQVSPQAA